MAKNKNLIYIAVSLIAFLVLAFLYSTPVFTGKQLFQHDIVQYRGGAKELIDYRNNYDKETYWSDSMFGGMPTYQMGSRFEGDIIKKIDSYLNILPRPVNYLFLLFSGFFLLGMVAVRNWKYALLGATFFGLSTYFYIIIAAGHNGKVNTIEYFAPLLAGILLVYIRKKYVLGFIVTTLFFGLQIAANHPQMTYYLFLGLGFLFISELVRAIKKKVPMKHFLISSGIIASALAIGVGMNSQRIMANSEYIKETVRGKQILNTETHTAGNTGMDKESILMWSYGQLETLNLFIPRLMGGGSQEPEGKEMMEKVQQLVQDNVTSQAEYDRISKGFGSLTYWGDQPGTSGPAYQGAIVCFLALLGFFFASKKYRYWILGATILTILLAWGSNFMPLSDFFIEYVPFYSKFRAPSSILVVVELLFPLIAIIGLYRFFNSETLEEDYKKKILTYVGGGTLGLTLLLIVFGKSILGFATDNEKVYLPPFLLEYLVDERFSMFRTDAIKALLYVGITVAVLFFALKQKLNQNIALVIIGLVSLFDLWTVNKRYLNDDNYVDKIFAENPFQTEGSDYLAEKVGDNANLQSILASIPVNKTLETIAENDKKHYRIYNQVLGTTSETNTSYFKASIGGYHAVKLRRYDDLLNEYIVQPDSIKTPKILNLLNTKYMIFGNPGEPQVVPNPKANGNAWFVSDLKFVNTPNEEIKAIGEIDSKKTAVINISDKSYFDNRPVQTDSTATINLTKYEANELEFKSQSKTPQLAVFSEIYYPHGWKVFVDEKEVPYIKADYLLRAVHVPAGNHHIKMIFEPQVIETGKWISLLCFGLFIALSAFGIYYIYRKRDKKQVEIIK
ncbi:YfhO family protein [Chryseobacterium sp. Ch-15]|uniref:YfhO family protein n=1 Tax=Chryseobacterium muglaense TaxID=2893752 RepID=A0A9Q3UVH8_9FLAO|nr:YfhO family protein [Chryseobacterium muglaense]MBD3905718.1 YfhO family protein [Chryseobacterium muglaense]MCC9034246.1 YfhO family protein [Chryseobacterium muglaense]MCM2555655.1 YfhO family protein [Chryseobacterium muglaense]